MLPLIIIGSIVGYFVGVGVTHALLPDDMKEDGAEPVDLVAALLWPLALPIMLGNAFAKRVRAHAARRRVPKATARKGAYP